MKPLYAKTSGLLVLLCAVAIGPVPSRALAEDTPLSSKVEAVRALVCKKPIQGLDTLFAPAFIKAVPPAKMVEILDDYCKKGGRVLQVLKTADHGPLFGEYRFFSEKGVFPVKIGVESGAPGLINTLWFGSLSPRFSSLKQVTAELSKLPGTVSLAVMELGGKRPRVLAQLNPDTPMALGSTFKLYVLGALVSAVARSEHRWDEVTALRDAWRSFPSGVLQTWPAGSPVTLHTLAGQMISISDNTATDHLLYLLGRAQVEAMQAVMGHKTPARNRPFLSVREMFLLKGKHRDDGGLAAYVGKDEKGRRAFLDETLAKEPRGSHHGLDLSRPVEVDRVEWFASASDLCRAMDWLRVQGEAGAPARAILGINRGLAWNESVFPYVGYKGGSEPGVLNLTWLAQRRDGTWLALSVGWNDPKAVLDEDRLFELTQGLILLLEDKGGR